MLDDLVLRMEYGVSYGSGSLKALQNINIPELDLLVREAIQNSWDASLEQQDESCCVNFSQGTFQPSKLNSYLSRLGVVLDRRYPVHSADYLEIRDYKTSGLTGPTKKSELTSDEYRDKHGNFFKLVFDTGKEQTNSSEGEAGGSWGYGKSVYYRVGIGLVIFYSQIKVSDSYEERLIVSLIERETDKTALLKEIQPDSVGRAWWGKRNPDDMSELLPITDHNDIQSVLDIFSIKKFSDTQTGTSVIIPYIDKSRLLSGIFPDNCNISDDEIAMCSYKEDIAQYIELAVQKWYAPRVFNKSLSSYSQQKWLAIRINDKPLRNTDMRPFFQLVQELFTTAVSANARGKIYKSTLFPDIKCVSIPSQKLLPTEAGHAACIKISKDELSPSGAPIKPYTYLRLFGKSSLNDPIVMFARTPGMILDYKIDGKWTKGLIKPENDDEYVVVFFVPNCSAKVKNEQSTGIYAGMSFGEYLRKTEMSDHMDWEDPASLTLITNIRFHIINKVNQILKDTNNVPIEGTASKLAGKLGRMLLPSLKFGKSPKGSSGGGSGGGSTSDNLEIIIGNTIFLADTLVLSFSVKFKNSRKRARIGIFVESETGLLDADAWYSDIGTTFPLSIISIKDCKTQALNSGNQLVIPGECTPGNPTIESDYTIVSIVNGENCSEISGFALSNTINNAIVSGTLIIGTADRKYCLTIKETRKNTLDRGEMLG